MASTRPRECSIAAALDVVGERWSLLVIRELLLGATRFDQIHRNTGAPRDILTARLRKLEQQGVIERVPYQDNPPRHDYLLTPAGRDLAPVLLTLKAWGDHHRAPQLFGGPPMQFEHDCGAPFEPRLVCHTCGEPLATGTLTTPPATTAAHNDV